MKLFVLITLTLWTFGCITPEEMPANLQKSDFRFPFNMYLQQSICVHHMQDKSCMIATLSKSSETMRLVLVDPHLLSELIVLDIESDNSVKIVFQHDRMNTIEDFDPIAVMSTIQTLFDSDKDIQLSGELDVETSRRAHATVYYSWREWVGLDDCKVPRFLTLRFSPEPQVKSPTLEIETTSVSCSHQGRG